MCVTCGCSGDGEIKITNLQEDNLAEVGANGHHHTHTLADGTVIAHSHESDHTHTLADGTVITHSHSHSSHSLQDQQASKIHAQMHGTTISLEQDILAKNELIAAQNRGWFKGRNILALNLVSSPGAGKTTLLTRTINDLKDQLAISVIEGDQETANDAQKIQETGCKVVQINTGTGCHLDRKSVV